ncbi:MAG: amino acid permease [Candidatus Bathyarchaeia archaeon]
MSDVFVRKASGLVRVVSPKDALVYAFMNPTIPYAFHYIIWSQALYPGANMYIAALFILTLFPIAGLYVLFSTAMPRSGGEYIYGSRVLSPVLGLLASWGMVLGGGLMWSGSLASWGTMWGIGAGTVIHGLLTGNQGLVDLGIALGDPSTGLAWVFGFLTIASCFAVMLAGTKWVMRAAWFVTAVTWIMLGSYIYINLTANPQIVAQRMSALQGLDYGGILQQAKDAGWMPGLVSTGATMMAGLTYLNLSTLGSTYVANIAGEIKEVRKAQILAQFGSLILFIIYWEIFTYATYSGLGIDLIQAISYLNAAGIDTEVFKLYSFSPVAYFLTVYLSDNWLLVMLAGPIGFWIINWGGILGLGFGPIRNLFAYAYDGIFPNWVCAVDRKGRAWGSVLLGFIIAVAVHTVNTFTPWLAYIAHTIAVWFISWFIVGVAGMVFHIRRRDIYEKSPAIVQKKIAGIPLTFILGLVTAIISAAVVYSVLYPALTGEAVALQLRYLASTILFLIVVPIIIFYASYYYRKAKGVPMDLRFKEVPPD